MIVGIVTEITHLIGFACTFDYITFTHQIYPLRAPTHFGCQTQEIFPFSDPLGVQWNPEVRSGIENLLEKSEECTKQNLFNFHAWETPKTWLECRWCEWDPGLGTADRLLGTAVCCSAVHTQSSKPRGSYPGRMGIPVPTPSFLALRGLLCPWFCPWLSPVLLPLACQQFLKNLLKEASGPQCCCHSITPRMSSPPPHLYSYVASSVHAHMLMRTRTHTHTLPPMEAHAGCVSDIKCCEQESFFFTI